MTTTTSSTALLPVAPVFTNTERLALAAFLAGYSSLTRQAYELDLRQYASWCHQHHLRLFQARRADIECFARDLEARGRARATITRRLCTVAGFYRYAVEEDLLDRCRGTPPVRTIHWPKVIASAWPLSIILADHRAFLLTGRNRPWTQIKRSSPPIGAAVGP
jgi:site-specific recombinase XerD